MSAEPPIVSRVSTALYRRYRPETFADVIGQEHVTAPLMAALDNGRVTHAYLFSGPRGCGKTTSARIFARCLNCANGPTSTPCGTCDSCVELARGGAGSIDVVEMDAASHGGVDDARELRERAAFAPARDRFKVFIIDEAHMVSTQGFNALLKLVEEPPPHVKFVFATTEPEKVIGTIRSRTHHYPFRLVPPEQLTGYLESLAEAEGVQVDSGVLPLVVRAGAGSVRDSLSVLDQLIAGTDDGVLGYERAVALLGFTHGTLLDDTVDALAAGDGASLFRVVDRVIESGHAPRRFVEDLLERLRDLIVVRAAGEQAASVLRAVPADQLERMRTQASHLSAATLSRAADLVNEALTEMAGATSPRLQLELLCARLLLPAADDGAEGFAVRLDRLEGALGSPQHGGAAAVPAARPVPPAPPPAATPVAPPAEPPRAAAEPGGTAPVQEQTAAGSAAQGAVLPAEGAPSAEPSHSAEDAAGPGGAVATGDTPASPEGAPTPAHRPVTAEERTAAGESAPGTPAAAPAAPGAAPEAQHPPVPEAAAPAPAEGAGAGGLTTAEVRRRWPEVLDTLARIKRTTWALISQDAQIVDLDAATLQLGFSTSGLASAFRNGQHAAFLQRALVETLGLDVRIEPIVADGSSGSGGFGGPAGSGGGPGGSSGPGGGPSGPGGSTPGGAGPTGSGPAASWDTPGAPPAQPEAFGDEQVPPSPGNSTSGAASTPPGTSTSSAGSAPPSGAGAPTTTSTPPPWDVPGGEPSGGPEGGGGVSAGADNAAQATGAGPAPVPSATDSLGEPPASPADTVPTGSPTDAMPSASPAEAAPLASPAAAAPGPGAASSPASPPWDEPVPGPEVAASPAIPPWDEPEPPASGPPTPAGTGPAPADPGPEPAAEFAESSEPEPAPPSAAPEWPQEPQRPAPSHSAGDPPPSGPAPGSTSPREQALAAAREARGASLSRHTPAASAPEAPDPRADYDPDPDDPDIESTGLAGAPLVARLLGGTVIDEILESPEGGDR